MTRGRRAIAFSLAGIVVGIAGVVSWFSMKEASRYGDAADAFFDTLRAGDFDRAYASLSPKRRAAMSAAEFRALADHPALRSNQRHDVYRSRTIGSAFPPEGACVRARLETPTEWQVQLFLVRSADATWHVESFGLQEPAPVVLEDLLEECGDDPARRAGYSGPPVVNRTTRVSH